MAQLLDIRVNEPERPEPVSPVAVLDQAFTVLRRAGAQRCLRGIAAGLPLAAALISLYALERVLDARPSLPLFAALCVLAYWARYHMLSRFARELVRLISQTSPPQCSLLAGLQTALIAGIGSCAWAGFMIVAGQGSFFGLLACLPLLCVRGAVAPSLLARSACAPEGGKAAFVRAVADTRELRQLFVRVELFALIGLLLLFGNLYALVATLLLVASSMIGVDVGFVSALITPDNELVLLLLLGLATLLLEPLRAAISAIAFQHAREQTEGADLRAAIDALPSTRPQHLSRPQPTAAARSLAGLILLSCLLQGQAHADDAGHTRQKVQERADDASRALPAKLRGEVGAVDGLARQKAQAILARSEFLPSASDSERGPVQAWLDRRLRERERELSDHDLSTPARFELRISPWVVVLVSLLVLLGVSLWVLRGLRRARIEANAARLRASSAPTQADHLAQAARFAEEGSYAQAVRSLFAACLQAIARGRPAGFSSARAQTNGQLLTQLAPGQLRAAFEPLSEVFDRCCYGRQPLARADYETAHELAALILQLAPDSSEMERAR